MTRRDATTVATLICDEAAARRLADLLVEMFDPAEVAVAAFEEACGRWAVSAHFRLAPDEAGVRSLVASLAGQAAAAAVSFQRIAPRDWVAASLEGLHPVEAGRVVVHGAHDRARIATNRIAVEIEAALAFGTGHHGTTRGCLLALERTLKSARPKRILDVGTGTGVLAIAAAKALRRPVLATDIDPRAVSVAQANVAWNGAAAWVTVRHAVGVSGRLVGAGAPYDLIFANILAPVLKRLAAPVARLLRPGGRLVLSGLLPEQANAVLAAHRAQKLSLDRRRLVDGWVTLEMRRPLRPSALAPYSPKQNQARRTAFSG